MSEVDWKLILAKYIDNVAMCEGVYFDPGVGPGPMHEETLGGFTQEEVDAWWEALKLTNPEHYEEHQNEEERWKEWMQREEEQMIKEDEVHYRKEADRQFGQPHHGHKKES